MRNKITLLTLLMCFAFINSQADQWTENFESATLSSYDNTDFSLNGRTWKRQDAGKVIYGETSVGSKCIVINDDCPNAHITSPLLITCGTVSFKYAYKSGSSSNTFSLQKSTDGSNWTTLEEHTLGAASNQALVDYSFAVNETNSIYIRILSDDMSGHLFIDDFTVDNYLGSNTALLVWAGSHFNESTDNDGSINDSIQLSLLGETFALASGSLSQGTHYGYSNLPSGLSLSISLSSDSLAYIHLTGTANNHAAANSINSLNIIFNNAAFTSDDASTVGNHSKNNIAIQFLDPYVNPDILISEIMYNPPESGADTLEFVELRNFGSTSVNLNQFSLEGVNYTFGDVDLAAGAYLVIAKNAQAINNTFGVEVLQWTSGTLSNTGETVRLRSADNLVVDELTYDDGGEWNNGADGTSYSLVYCGTDKSMNDDGGNWVLSESAIAGADFHCSPKAADAACSSSLANLKWDGLVFNESASDDGSISNTLHVSLTSDAFAISTGNLVPNTHYTVNNIPDNLSLQISISDAHNAILSLSGNALAHLESNSINNIELQFLDAAFTAYTASQVNHAQVDLSIQFNNPLPPKELTWSALELQEALANNGQIHNTISLNLISAEFTGNNNDTLLLGTAYTVSNLPENLSTIVQRLSAHEAKIYFVGAANQHAISDNVSNIEIHFLDPAFNNPAADILNSSQTLNTAFLDPYPTPNIIISEIMYNPPESGADTLEFIELFNSEIEAVNINDFSLLGVSYTFDNVVIPALSYVVIASDSTAIFNTFGVHALQWTSGVLANNGEPIALYNQGGVLIDSVNYDDTSDWPSEADGLGTSIVYCGSNNAENDVASNWEPSTQVNSLYPNIKASPGSLDYNCIPHFRVVWSDTVFVESTDNDGSISNKITLTLEDLTFSLSSGDFVENTHYTFNNLPAGLSLNIHLISDVQAEVTINGAAENHMTSDNIENLSIAFTDDAFAAVNANIVAQSSKDNLGIHYQNTYTTPTVTWAAAGFEEADANDGSIANTMNITLQNLHFSESTGALASEKYSVANLPEGLSLSITLSSNTEAQIQISGTANQHEAVNSVENLSIELASTAFAETELASITGNPKTDLFIHFKDEAQLFWSQNIFWENMDNEGGISDSLILRLKNAHFETEANLNASSFFQAEQLPEGLNLSFTYYNDTAIVFHFTGQALAHAASNSIGNLQITFLDAAFNNYAASHILNYNKTLSIQFKDPYIRPHIFISEIMYNPPETGTDSLEYIELHSLENETINLKDYTLEGVNYTFGDVNIEADSFIVIAKNAQAMQTVYNVNALEWQSGVLNNNSKTIAFYNPGHELIDEVTYSSSGSWPSLANGNGSSLVYCGESGLINDFPVYWTHSTTEMSSVIAGLKGSPGRRDDNCSGDLETSVGLIQLKSTKGTCHFTGTDTIKVAFQNTGATLLDVGDSLIVSCQVAGGASVEDTLVLNVPIVPTHPYIYTFSSTFDLSSLGAYTCAFNVKYIKLGAVVAESSATASISSYELNIGIVGATNDTIHVTELPYTIQATSNAMVIYHPVYEWQDGTLSGSFTADSEGWYKVNLSDDNSCFAKDSVYIRLSTLVGDRTQSDYVVYPNPTHRILNVNAYQLSKAELIDLNGKLIKSYSLDREKEQQHLSVEGQKSGIYLLKLYFEETVKWEKIIILD